MEKRWKNFIIVVTSLVLIALAVTGVGIYWFVRHFDEFIATGEKSRTEGAEFGKTTDNAACLQEALTRYQRDSSISGTIAAQSFLDSCLEASRPTPGFCDNVPRKAEM